MTDHPGRILLLAATLPGVAGVLFLLAGMWRRRNRPSANPSAWPARFAVALMVITAGLALYGLTQFRADAEALAPHELRTRYAESAVWVEVGPISAAIDAPATTIPFGYKVDHLSSALLVMVAVVAGLIVLYSTGYMRDELEARHIDHEAHITRKGRSGRFFAYLLLFTSSMLHLLLADNLLQIFVCWELVGVCSYLLIGYYVERPAANRAALKAFVLNRVGDAGFLVALAVAFAEFGTFDIEAIAAGSAEPWAWTLLGLGVFAGCCGKSAQFPLHVWLPDAMEGPTPVSALIHAATMVAAGVYLAARAFPLFAPDVLLIIAYIGAVTLTIGATSALFQTDLKRILAYSTVSQLGYMILAIGVGAWGAAALHLVTHACFKALLFLGAGSVIHACHHKQDLASMGGLRRKLPWTSATMLVGVLAISGVPLLSGWYSKDQILAGCYEFAGHRPEHLLLAVLPFACAGLTAFYMGRLWLLTFTGEPRDAEIHAHESPWVMRLPLVLLALASVGIAWGWPVIDPHASALGRWLEHSSPVALHAESSHVPGLLGLLAAGVGLASAFVIYRKGGPVAAPKRGWRRATYSAFGFDALFRNVMRRPMVALGLVAARLDRSDGPADSPAEPATIDGLFEAGARGVGTLGRVVSGVQTGRLADYLAVVALTVAAILAILM